MNNIHANPVEPIKKEIYIIKNDLNNKVYIGQAIDSKEWKSCGVRNFTYEQVTEIIYRLKNDPISINKMAKEYGVNPNTIYCINSGTSKKYRRDEETYPIRPF